MIKQENTLTKYAKLRVKFRLSDWTDWYDEDVEAEITKGILRIIDALGQEILFPMDVILMVRCEAKKSIPREIGE